MNAPIHPEQEGRVRCAECGHAEPSLHRALVACGSGREALAACGLWWSLDWRVCGEFVAKDGTEEERRDG